MLDRLFRPPPFPAPFPPLVDAKDDQAEAFYLHHGFVKFGSQPRQLVLPLAQLRAGS